MLHGNKVKRVYMGLLAKHFVSVFHNFSFFKNNPLIAPYKPFCYGGLTMNYRQLYKERYSVDFSGDYDIHHIDFNHSNNDISNLLLLPHDLHVKYHNLVNYYSNSKQKTISPLITGNEVNANTYLMDLLEDLIRTITECNKWYDYKLYLDGKLPNIHNIEVQ